MNANVSIAEIEPEVALLEGNLACLDDFRTDKDREFLAAIENLTGILGTPKEFYQKLNATTDENDWKGELCKGILEKYYEEDIY